MLGQLIPQVFYDAIGRLVPGSVLVGTCGGLWPGAFSALLHGSALLSIPAGAAWLIGSYLVALLLEGCWNLVLGDRTERLHRRGKLEAKKHALRDFKRLVPEFDSSVFEFPGIPMMYDVVRLVDPIVGANIVKLRAEVQLCRSLLLGWLFILVGLGVDAAMNQTPGEHGVAAGTLIVAVLVMLSLYVKRQGRVLWSLYNHWLLLVQPGTAVIEKRGTTANSGLKRAAGAAA